MSKNKDPLKEILEKKYAELNEEKESPKEVKEDAQTVDVSKIIYVPHVIGKKSYIVAMEYRAVVDAGFLNKPESSAKVIGIAPLAQTIITKLYKQDQTNLKYYYEKAKRRESK